MRTLAVLIIGLLCAAASLAYEYRGLEVDVAIVERHPFLVDHGRQLVIRAEGTVIATQSLYPDAGDGRATTSIYREGDDIIVIDCNGSWFRFAWNTRRLTSIGWKWLETPPKDYIGTYRYDKHADKYVLDTTPVQSYDLYRHKDPT